MSTPESNGRAPTTPDASAADAAADKLEAELNDEFDDGVGEERASGIEIAFTPRQILGGFVLCAALILLLRRRRRSDPSAGD